MKPTCQPHQSGGTAQVQKNKDQSSISSEQGRGTEGWEETLVRFIGTFHSLLIYAEYNKPTIHTPSFKNRITTVLSLKNRSSQK
jgi:hypothetical protein